MDRKRTALLIATLIGVMAVATPIVLALILSKQQGESELVADVGLLADDVLRRMEKTNDQMAAAIDALAAHGAPDPCSDDTLALMAQFDMKSTMLQAVGYVADNQLVCSSNESLGRGVSVGLPEYVSPHGVEFRTEVTFPSMPRTPFLVVKRASSGYTAIVHRDLPIDAFAGIPDVALGVVGYTSRKVIVHRGHYDPAWREALGIESSKDLNYQGYIVAIRRSSGHDVAAYAAVPVAFVQAGLPRLAVVLVPIGIVAGLALVLAVVYVTRTRFAMEDAADASRAKSTFLATMSHEIRTPMIGVLGMLEVLTHTRLTPEQRRGVGMVQQSAKALLQILGEVLDLSKIEAGRLDLAPTHVSLGRLVEECCHSFLTSASSKGLRLTHSIDPALAPAHLADPVRIRQILSNFLSNALKFTSKGGIDVRVRAGAVDDGRQRMTIEVQDTGIGISARNRKKLFEPFSQAEESTTRRYGGTGLGLAICRRLATIMGGEVTLDSTDGVGTTLTFTVTLPLGDPARVERPDAAEPGRSLIREKPNRAQAIAENSLLLLVEDHPVSRDVLTQQLGIAGFEIDAASNGREALDKFSAGGYALVFTDLHMPEMDGMELTRAIRERERAAGRRRTPVLALTAAALPDEMNRCFAAGMDDFILKPPTIHVLASKLRHWLPHLTWGAPAEATVSTAPAAESPLDEAVLQSLAPSVAGAQALLEKFSGSIREDLRDVELALDGRDAAEVAAKAHRIRGASSMVGATGLAAAAGELERSAAAGRWETIREQVRALGRACEELDRYLRQRPGASAAGDGRQA